ncbi:MAG TPA: hypothetical protein VGK25_05690 [Ignavibacteria bacterium]|jgi:hypothetical protein
MLIQKPGKSKQQLLSCLAKLKVEFKAQVAENDIIITDIADGYLINAQKKVLFLTFWVKAKIIAANGAFELTWETNAPENKVREALDNIIKFLEKC